MYKIGDSMEFVKASDSYHFLRFTKIIWISRLVIVGFVWTLVETSSIFYSLFFKNC